MATDLVTNLTELQLELLDLHHRSLVSLGAWAGRSPVVPKPDAVVACRVFEFLAATIDWVIRPPPPEEIGERLRGFPALAEELEAGRELGAEDEVPWPHARLVAIFEARRIEGGPDHDLDPERGSLDNRQALWLLVLRAGWRDALHHMAAGDVPALRDLARVLEGVPGTVRTEADEEDHRTLRASLAFFKRVGHPSSARVPPDQLLSEIEAILPGTIPEAEEALGASIATNLPRPGG